MKHLVAPIRLRASTAGRKVTWLELFFDLVFVAAVAQVAEPLHEHYTLAGLARFTPLFILVWWAWTGHAVFSTRFDSDDGVQRALTLLQVFAVAVMAANAKDALDSRSSAGFAAAYAVVRFVLVAQYARSRLVPGAHTLATRYLTGHGVAALVWLVSAAIPAPGRFWIWAAAFAIDLGTPWLAVQHSVRVPPDAAHLPERFGLFTLILLGESVVAVMRGIESQEDWTPAAATSAFLGMALSFLICWWYFDIAGAAAEQPVRTRRDAFRFHVWTYAHFPLYLAVIVMGAGVQRIVTAASRTSLNPGESAILAGAAAAVMLALALIGAVSAKRQRHRPADWIAQTALATVMLVVGLMGRFTSPLALINVMGAVLLTGLTSTQAGLRTSAAAARAATDEEAGAAAVAGG
jgi:low temperature requirement protein LtrA